MRSYVKSRADRTKGHLRNLTSRPGEQWKLFRGRENHLTPTNNPNTIKVKINDARTARNYAKKIFMNKNLEIQKLKVLYKTALRRKNQINRFNQRANKIRQIHSSFYKPTNHPVNQVTQTNNRPVNQQNNRARNQGTQTNNRTGNQGTQTNNRSGVQYNGKLSNNERRAGLIKQLSRFFPNENNLKTRSIQELVKMKQNYKTQESNAYFLLTHGVPTIDGMSPNQMKQMRRDIENKKM